ncbi:MAG: tetratricopeptide repeat protein [bacterium]
MKIRLQKKYKIFIYILTVALVILVSYKPIYALNEQNIKSHSDTATSYNNIGFAYDEQGKYEEALTWYKKSLAINEKELGLQHPDTAASYNNIGLVYKAQGNHKEAQKWYSKAHGKN